MKIFSAEQFASWDKYTITNTPIKSIDLMERAAQACVDWLQQKFELQTPFSIICGTGNNGGDGLAIARLLYVHLFEPVVYIIGDPGNTSSDFAENLKRLQALNSIKINWVNKIDDLLIEPNSITIDAIFGTGLNKPLSGIFEMVVRKINHSKGIVISIDLPSGLFADSESIGNTVIHASNTLTFQTPKLGLLLPENNGFTGELEILDIGLSKVFHDENVSNYYFITKSDVEGKIKHREKFSHKGNFGHAFIVAGSYGKTGAALLASKAALRSGCGLVTVQTPACGYNVLQTAAPEAMLDPDTQPYELSETKNIQKYQAIGIGPGIGTSLQVTRMLNGYLEMKKPLVLDADAINILSLLRKADSDLVIPSNSILTPHPREFERLVGPWKNSFEKMDKLLDFCKKNKIYVILKGAYSIISTPSGQLYFNSTGNPGMAKGGSGDVLTGLITGILAQGFSALDACKLSVFVHGMAGDLALKDLGETSMNSGDIINYLPQAFIEISGDLS